MELWSTSSSLDIDHMDFDNTTVVDIDLDLPRRVANISTLAMNVNRRCLDLDLNRLVRILQLINTILDHMKYHRYL